VFRGLTLRVKLQHGQLFPSHIMKISQVEQRFCPDAYRPVLNGLSLLYFLHVPLHTIRHVLKISIICNFGFKIKFKNY